MSVYSNIVILAGTGWKDLSVGAGLWSGQYVQWRHPSEDDRHLNYSDLHHVLHQEDSPACPLRLLLDIWDHHLGIQAEDLQYYS